MTSSAEFVDRVRARTENSPYVLTETPKGFRVDLDVANAHWFGALSAAGIGKAFAWDVHLDEAQRKYSVTDESREMAWGVGESGRPEPHLSKSVQRGRIMEKSSSTVYAFGDDGSFGKQLDYSFDSSEGRNLVTSVGDELGWSSGLPMAAKIGLYAGIGGVVFALLVVVLVLVMAL